MTGIEPDEIIDSQQWIDHQGGAPDTSSMGEAVLGTMAGLGALAYGLSKKEPGTLRPMPGEFRRNFNKVCKWYLLIILSPFVVMLTWAVVVTVISVAGGDHNSIWHDLCDKVGPIPNHLCD